MEARVVGGWWAFLLSRKHKVLVQGQRLVD